MDQPQGDYSEYSKPDTEDKHDFRYEKQESWTEAMGLSEWNDFCTTTQTWVPQSSGKAMHLALICKCSFVRWKAEMGEARSLQAM